MVKSLRSAFSKRPAAAERLFSYAQILLGALIGGAAYPLFMTPTSIAPGGITGIATILNHLFRWPVGTVTLLLNLPLFLISYRAMGRIFAFRSLVATIFFTLFIDILPLQPMTTDPLLGALYGGVMLGCGLGLIMRGGATSGGSDMVAKMVNKRFQFISTGICASRIFSDHFRPFDPDLRIVPSKTALVIGMVKVIAFIAELRLITQYQEPMSKASWNQILFLIVRCENLPVVFSVGCRSHAQIHSDIIDNSLDDSHQFCLRETFLKVKPA